MAIPTSPFDATKSIYAGLSVIDFTPAGGSSTVFESRLLDISLDETEQNIKRPDANGVLRSVRTVVTESTESMTFEVDEAKRLATDLFGGALTGRVTGVATIWVPDPDDDTGKVALKSEVGFPCTISVEGNIKFGDGDFTKVQLKLVSNKQGAITWTVDGLDA